MRRSPVYISAPFAASSKPVVWANVEWACTLSRFAMFSGYAPLVLHPAIHLGAYGRDEDPDDRKAGIEAACALADLVGCHSDGRLWVILHDDGSMSEGVAAESDAFRCALDPIHVDVDKWVESRTRDGWKTRMMEAGFNE